MNSINGENGHARVILEIIEYAEGLKRELRNAWLSDDRRESVAEHSWRMLFMAFAIAPSVELELDWLKTMKMIIIHDFAEIETGDIPSEKQTDRIKKLKIKAEEQAIEKIIKKFQGTIGKEIGGLWQEYEEQQTNEAKVVKVLDKLEAVIQKYQFSDERWKTLKEHQKKGDYNGYFEKLKNRSQIDRFINELVDLALEKRFNK